MEPLRCTSEVGFGTFKVLFDSGEVRSGSLRIGLQQQPLKLLEILLERPGEVVSSAALRKLPWASESFGDFDQAASIAVGKFGSVRGYSAENRRSLETLPKRRLRLIADVSVWTAGLAGWCLHPRNPSWQICFKRHEPGLATLCHTLTNSRSQWHLLSFTIRPWR